MKNLLTPLAESVPIPRIVSRKTVIQNKEINDTIKRAKALEKSGILFKSKNEIIENETKQKRRGFISMLFNTLCASVLGNMYPKLLKVHLEQVKTFESTLSFI